MSATTAGDEDLQAWLLDPLLAATWQPLLPAAATRWAWFRGAADEAVSRGAAALGVRASAARPALAAAFGAWTEGLDRERRHEPLDGADFARYGCGMLMAHLQSAGTLQAEALPDRRTTPPALLRAQAVPALQLRLCLTLLDGWLRAIGAPPLALQPPHASARHLASCFENLGEDPNQAPAFVDALTGAEPNWLAPALVAERPAMRRAAAAGRLG